MLLNRVMKYMAVLLAAGTLISAAALTYETWAAKPSPQVNDGQKSSNSEDAAKIQAILSRAIEAHGGQTSLAKQKITRMKGTYRRYGTEGTAVVSWEQITQLPDRTKNIQEAEIDGQKMSMTIVLRGDQGWMSTNGQLSDLDKQAIASMKEDLYADEVSSLLPLKGKEYQLSILAEVMVNGQPAVGVKVAAKGHRDVRLYFDRESGLLVKRVQRMSDGNGGQMTQEEFFSDYKVTDKVKMPRKLVNLTDGEKIAEASITEVQLLDKIEDKEFDKPGSPVDVPQKEREPKKKQGAASPLPAREAVQKDKRQAMEKPVESSSMSASPSRSRLAISLPITCASWPGQTRAGGGTRRE